MGEGQEERQGRSRGTIPFSSEALPPHHLPIKSTLKLAFLYSLIEMHIALCLLLQEERTWVVNQTWVPLSQTCVAVLCHWLSPSQSAKSPRNDLRNAGTGRLPGPWFPLFNDCFLLTVLVYLPALGNLCMLFDVLDCLCPDLPCTLTPFCPIPYPWRRCWWSQPTALKSLEIRLSSTGLPCDSPNNTRPPHWPANQTSSEVLNGHSVPLGPQGPQV